MGINFNLVASPRPYGGFYGHRPVFFAASPVFTLGLTAAAVGMGALIRTFNSQAHPPQQEGGARFVTQVIRQPAPPAQTQPPAQVEPPEPPKLATPLADALDGAKGLKRDSSDPKAVTALQKFLQKAGYGEMLGKTGADHDGVDGIFKGRTESALEQFQADNHLPRTGVLDEATVKKMHEVEQKMSTLKPEEAAPQKIAMQRRSSAPGMGG